jgi:hypothetical protein
MSNSVWYAWLDDLPPALYVHVPLFFHGYFRLLRAFHSYGGWVAGVA